jgi:hypothetical protein
MYMNPIIHDLAYSLEIKATVLFLNSLIFPCVIL